MSSNKCFYLTYFFFIYYISKMPLRYRKKMEGLFVFFNSHANTEKVRKEPCYLFNSRSALRREQSVLPQASAPAWAGEGLCLCYAFFFNILFFFRPSLALSVLMNWVKPAQINLVSGHVCSLPLSIAPVTDRTQGWKQPLGTPRESSVC